MRALLGLFLFFLLLGCETTGDPTQGGLLGWSESKAKLRTANLEGDLAYQNRLRERAERGSSDTSAQRSNLAEQTANKEAELASLDRDVVRLESLLAQDQTKAAELNSELVLLKQAIAEARRSQDSYASSDALRKAKTMKSDLWERATAQ